MLTTILTLSLAAMGAAPDAPLVEDAALQQLGMKRFWEARLPLTGDDKIADAYLVNEAVYVVSRDGRVFSLKADVGLLRWGDTLTERHQRIFPPRHLKQDGSSGPVVVPTSVGVFIIDRYTGQTIKRFTPPFVVGSAAVGFDHMLFAGGADGRFYSLQLDPRGVLDPIRRWEVLAGGPVTAAPLLYGDETLLFAAQSGSVFACSAQDKTYRWSFKTDGPIEGDPAIDDTAVYVGSADRSLYKLDRRSGERVWRARFPSPLKEGPVVAGGLVYQYARGNGLVALDVKDGKEKWRLAEGHSLAAHSAAGDVIFTDDAQLLAVEHETGKSMGAIGVPDVAFAISNPGGDAVYLLGTRGRVTCVRLDDVPYLRRQQVMAAKQQLNQSPDSKRKVEPLPPLPQPEPDPLANDPLRSDKDRTP